MIYFLCMTQESGRRIRILIVDGDKFLIGVYSVKFGSKGFEVDSAHRSLEVLKKLRAGNIYDIVLLEVVLPALSGIELLRTIRKENLLPTIDDRRAYKRDPIFPYRTGQRAQGRRLHRQSRRRCPPKFSKSSRKFTRKK